MVTGLWKVGFAAKTKEAFPGRQYRFTSPAIHGVKEVQNSLQVIVEERAGCREHKRKHEPDLSLSIFRSGQQAGIDFFHFAHRFKPDVVLARINSLDIESGHENALIAEFGRFGYPLLHATDGAHFAG